ncbi:hypothetical protein HKD37_04G010200 [Glycine soja]
MATPPSSPPPPTGAASQLPSTLKRTRKATRLRSLATRPVGAERPLVHVDPVTGKGDGPHIKKLRTYLGIVAHDKVDVTYENWKQVPANQKDLIWEDIQLNLISLKWALSADKESVDDTVCEKYDISKEKWTQFCQTLCERGMSMCMDSSSHSPSRDLGNRNLNHKNSKRDVYLGAYLNGALKGLDDTPQSKSKTGARWIFVETIGTKEIQGASHLVDKVLFES